MTEENKETKSIITAEEAKKIAEIMNKAKDRGVQKVKNAYNKLRDKYNATIDKLDEKIVIPASVTRHETVRKQTDLRRRVLNENLETRKSIIRLDKKIIQLQELTSQLKVMSQIEQDPFGQVQYNGRIQLAEERIIKMRIARNYLEGVLQGLNITVEQLTDELFLTGITPIQTDLDDLFKEIDQAQAITNQLATEDIDTVLKELDNIGFDSY